MKLSLQVGASCGPRAGKDTAIFLSKSRDDVGTTKITIGPRHGTARHECGRVPTLVREMWLPSGGSPKPEQERRCAKRRVKICAREERVSMRRVAAQVDAEGQSCCFSLPTPPGAQAVPPLGTARSQEPALVNLIWGRACAVPARSVGDDSLKLCQFAIASLPRAWALAWSPPSHGCWMPDEIARARVRRAATHLRPSARGARVGEGRLHAPIVLKQRYTWLCLQTSAHFTCPRNGAHEHP